MTTVYVLLIGEGCDGDEQHLHGVYSSRERAEAARIALEISDYRSHIAQYVVDEEENP